MRPLTPSPLRRPSALRALLAGSSGSSSSSTGAGGAGGGVHPRVVIVACCFLATLVAYVERVGFSIAFSAMAKAAGLGEASKGAVLSAFYWGYGVSQIPGGWAAQLYGGRRTLAASFAAWTLATWLTPTDDAARRRGAIVAARVAVGLAQGGLIPAVHTVLAQWVPPHERARAVSLTTSGMYLGSAAAMLALPSVAAALGPAGVLRLVGWLGALWLLLWLLLGRDVPHREGALTHAASRDADASTNANVGGPGGAAPAGATAVVVSTATAAPSVSPVKPSPAAAAAAALPLSGAVLPLATPPPSPTKQAGGGTGKPPPVAAPPPWRRLLRSPAVWAIIANNFAFHYAFYIVMNWLPTYFGALLRRELASLGPLKALPYLAMFATSNIGCWVGDALIARWQRQQQRRGGGGGGGILTGGVSSSSGGASGGGGGGGVVGCVSCSGGGPVAAARKAVNAAGMAAAAGALMLMPLARGAGGGLAATTAVMASLGFARGGFSVNHMDVAPAYAGAVMGISNTAGTLAGVVGVAATGCILDASGGAAALAGWWRAHALAAAVLGAAALVFNAAARGTRQFE